MLVVMAVVSRVDVVVVVVGGGCEGRIRRLNKNRFLVLERQGLMLK